MRSLAIGFVLGAALLQTQADLPSWYVLLPALAVAACLVPMARRLRTTGLRIAASLALGALAGFAWAGLFAAHYLSRELPAEWEGRDITLVGVVDSLPVRLEQGMRFNFEVERVLAPVEATDAIPGRLALSWYAGRGADAGDAAPQLQPGERWRLTVRLRRPHGNANPHGFDYEVWLLEQNLRATGYVRAERDSSSASARLDGFVPRPDTLVERCRAWLRTRIEAALPDRPYAGVITALVIGDQRAIAQSNWKVFNRTGISHLVSISGLHITMVAGLFAWLAAALWRRSFFTDAELPLRLPTQKAAALTGAAAALLYVLLAGFGVPAQRTLYMLTVVAAALWLGRITHVSQVLCAALGVVVLLDPWAVLWPGFWLSFGAVAIILYVSVGRPMSTARGPWAALRGAALVQYAITLGLVPLTMLLFGQVSLVGPLANAVAIPLVSFLVTPLALVGAFAPAPLSDWLLGLAHFLVAQLAALLQYLSGLPLAVWSAPIPSALAFGCALAGMLWLLAPRGWPLRWLGAFALLPLFLTMPVRPPAGQMWVTAFDVGQGMALLIETPDHRLLYDAGPAYSPESDGGSRVIVPYLKARGISALDGMIVSHSDTDHSGGALSVLGEIEVGWLASSLPPEHGAVRAARAHRRCEAGQSWEWDGVHFEMLHPAVAIYDSSKWKPNARSCTLRITLGEQAMLLPGDIEAVQEAELVEAAPDKLRATVLLAPHHGSGTSSTLPFLQAVAPEVALFQVGYRNRYRHPKPEIYQRYGELGIRRLRSDESGAIELRFGEALRITEYRREHARYWYGR